MNPLFERLSLQGHLRRIIERAGPDQAWQIIQAAVERELRAPPDPASGKYLHAPDRALHQLLPGREPAAPA